MTIKLGYRSLPAITPSSEEFNEQKEQPRWLSDFARNLCKTSVQPRRQESVFEQINSIMNGAKSKYSTVDAAVKDMQERSGLLAYQDKIRTLANLANTIKNAAEKGEVKIKVFELCPQSKQTIDNIVDDCHGNLPIPAILDKAKQIHKRDIAEDDAWDDQNLLSYVNDRGTVAKKMYPSTDDSNASLGRNPRDNDQEIDKSNTDALISLMPATFQ